MKRLFFIAVALSAAFAVSCSSTDPDTFSGSGDDSILGTWLMRADEWHYFDVTFKKDGSYSWTWDGASGKLLDTGTYKYENNVVTTTATKFFEEDHETHVMKEADFFNTEWNKVRTITFVKNEGAVAWCTWENDYFVENSDFRGNNGPILLFKEGADVKFGASDLKGTWELTADSSIDRIIFENNSFTWYSAWPNTEAEGGYSVRKDTGTWSLNKNVLTFEYKKAYSSYKTLGWNQATQQNEYIYYKVDPVTLEAEQWESYDSGWSHACYIYISDGKLIMPNGTYTKK